jgi:hypothetical protein
MVCEYTWCTCCMHQQPQKPKEKVCWIGNKRNHHYHNRRNVAFSTFLNAQKIRKNRKIRKILRSGAKPWLQNAQKSTGTGSKLVWLHSITQWGFRRKEGNCNDALDFYWLQTKTVLDFFKPPPSREPKKKAKQRLSIQNKINKQNLRIKHLSNPLTLHMNLHICKGLHILFL